MMNDAGEARAAILARIRRANSDVEAARHSSPEQGWQSLPRTYTLAGPLDPKAVLELFEQRLDDYGAQVFHSTAAELPQVIARVLTDRQKQRVVIPGGIPETWLPPGISFRQDDGIAAAELDRCDGVLTTATVAIAATGTIVLQNATGQGRRVLSLVPDYHLCVVLADQVVETVPEAFARLEATSTLSTTFISGPSATADIEMTRIQGVHGPRYLDVLLVAQGNSDSAIQYLSS